MSSTWLKGDNWRRPESRVEELYSSDLYADLAVKAERAKLDFVFKPDALHLNIEALDQSAGFGSLDPTVLMATIARETQRIGLITTASTSFNAPYLVARQLQSLHWASNGRAGLNIVTSMDGAANFGDRPLPPSEARYAGAAEFVEVVRRLWDSYPHETLRLDRASGRFGDSSGVHPIDYRGEHYHVRGPLNVPSHPAGGPPLLQAGASPAGRAFAAATADAVFAASPDSAAGIELRRDLRQRAADAGRRPDEVRVLPGLYFFLARTRAEAMELHREAHVHLDEERRYASVERLLGIDLRETPPDRPVTEAMLDDPSAARPVWSRTHAEQLRALVRREQPTVRALLSRPEVVGSGHWVVAGTPEDALEAIVARREAGALDGLIALPGGSLSSLDLFLEEVVPMLAERGMFRDAYTGTTLREHLDMG
nr:NtaA/DmoA family FMN-dependent monooxygenase [Paenibacillus sp. 598K]